MSFSFKYRKEKINGKVNYFPKMPITLFNGGVKFECAALLDSGATNIFIPKQIAEALELEFTGEDRADGWLGTFKVWSSRIGIVIAKGSQTFRKSLPCFVPDSDSESQEVILGRTFFKFFEITFNEEKKVTKLKKAQ